MRVRLAVRRRVADAEGRQHVDQVVADLLELQQVGEELPQRLDLVQRVQQGLLGLGVEGEPRADRVPLRVVRVQQAGRGPALDGRRELPAEVHRVLHAGVQPLAAEREMDVRGVPGQEHPALAVALREAGRAAEPRQQVPVAELHVDAHHPLHRLGELVGGERQIAVRRHHVELHRGEPVDARLHRDLRVHPALREPRAVEGLVRVDQLDVPGDPVDAGGGAREGDADELADGAGAPVTAHQVGAPELVVPGLAVHLDGDPVLVLGEPGDLVHPSHVGAELDRVLLQALLDVALRDALGDHRRVDDVLQLQQAEVVGAGRAVVVEPVQTALPEALQRPDLERLGPRPLRRLGELVEDDDVHPRQAQLTGQHQAGRASTGDDDRTTHG